MPPVKIDPTEVSDAVSAGSTEQFEGGQDAGKSESKASDPKVRNALESIRKHLTDGLEKSSDTMDKANAGARQFETNDAATAAQATALTSPAAPTPGASTQPAPRLSAAQLSGPSQPAMPSMTPVSPVSQFARMAAPAMQTAAGLAAPIASMASSAAAPAMMPATATGGGSGSDTVTLTPAQQAQLAAIIDANGDTTEPAESTGTDVSTGNAKLDELVKQTVASEVPYSWGGGTLEGPSKGISDGGGAGDAHGDYNKVGFDCSGLTRYLAYQSDGVEIPRTSQAQYSASAPVTDPKPGDLVFPKSSFVGGNGPGHVQMYIGDGKVVHAPQSGSNVQITALAPDSEVRRAA
ncbi:C40 family peptidase [Rhodococcus sp. BS-15]|uniref:C40 family peptidase n=1 Tax=Rhodococcus sp. BS-15 TaxID=1304954 RepID=UPI000AAB3D40|nr:C40 family peptidase [Rhodococcus sp. BS-15]